MLFFLSCFCRHIFLLIFRQEPPAAPPFIQNLYLCKPKGDGGIATVFFSDTLMPVRSVYLSPLKNSARSESVAYIVAFSPMTRYVPTTPGSFPVSFVAPVRSVRVQEPSGTRSPEDNATADHALLTTLSDGTENLFFFPIVKNSFMSAPPAFAPRGADTMN